MNAFMNKTLETILNAAIDFHEPLTALDAKKGAVAGAAVGLIVCPLVYAAYPEFHAYGIPLLLQRTAWEVAYFTLFGAAGGYFVQHVSTPAIDKLRSQLDRFAVTYKRDVDVR
ncbi:MAG: hypothetical protein V1743_01415 [Nanoarchaeota archaeon]